MPQLKLRELDVNPRVLVPCLIILAAVIFGGPKLYELVAQKYGATGPEIQYQTPEDDVRATVEGFGDVLKNVPLSAEPSIVSESVMENYKEYISSELLDRWIRNPNQALGRLTSSPWPERIAIESITKNTNGSYHVQGDIVDMTSEEMAHGGEASREPLALTVEQIDGSWVITGVTTSR